MKNIDDIVASMPAMAYKKEMLITLCASIMAEGFRVFISERGPYGFYTDAEGTRLVSFGIDLGTMRLSGNYKTSAPKSCGTGWRIDTYSTFEGAFNQCAPRWAIHDATWKYTTLAQYMSEYQQSSKFNEVQS